MNAVKIYLAVLLGIISNAPASAQGNPPWERPLKISTSSDGQFFTAPTIFQDSSGVPSLIKWKGDTLVCVFQWFRQPMNSATWDRVAVKFSYDNGINWTMPVPVVVNGIPPNYQRPFDPTLAVINSDSLRIFFSSSVGMPLPGGDSIIDTYSAVSVDGINFSFENGPRYNNSTGRVIDPAAIVFSGLWHYAAPVGAPQDGAYHCTSSDGINFLRQQDYLSDMQHNWTGNFMIYDSNELRFYGSGPQIWYNNSLDGFSWTGYVNTNMIGGDPSVVKIHNTGFIMIYVGEPYLTSVDETADNGPNVYPVPASDALFIENISANSSFSIYSFSGKLINTGDCTAMIDVSGLKNGSYVLLINDAGLIKRFPFTKCSP